MAPLKRKRASNAYANDSGENRGSPHQPQNPGMGQHDNRQQEMRDGGHRRPSRGGQGGGPRGGQTGGARGGRGGRNLSRPGPHLGAMDPNLIAVNTSARGTPTPGPMSPPPRPLSTTPTQAQAPFALAVDHASPVTRSAVAFEFDFLTDDIISKWRAGGRTEVVQRGIQARRDEDTLDLSTLFQELVRASFDDRLDQTELGTCVRDILAGDIGTEEANSAPSDSPDAVAIFLDCFSIMCDDEGITAIPSKGGNDLHPASNIFLAATGISPATMRQQLDVYVMMSSGLVKSTFEKIGTRSATQILYRQANYNLLREETEGYSKLLTELFTSSQVTHPTSEVVEEAFARVKGLIGSFDMDVGRVLDITLDAFAGVLIKRTKFFIKFLRASCWWPTSGETEDAALLRCGGLPRWALPSSPGFSSSEEDDKLSKQMRTERDTKFWERARQVGIEAFFELGGRQMVDDETKQQIFQGVSETELSAERDWINATGTFPPSGNRNAAQILGFKLRFYSSIARDKGDIMPQNLIYLTAILIKVGFISLKDIYAHLWPYDEDMPAAKEAKLKEMAEKDAASRPGGGTNALSRAGALADDTLPNFSNRSGLSATKDDDSAAKAGIEVDDAEKLPEPDDQKAALCRDLLTIGAMPEALYILGRFPWLPEVHPELIDLIHRILHYSIQDLFDLSRPTKSGAAECPPKQIVPADQSGIPKGLVRLEEQPPKRLLRWPYPDRFDHDGGCSYRFYWDEWADNVPVCQSVDDIFTLCDTLLNISDVSIGKDAALLSKLCRIGRKSLSDDRSQDNQDRWQELLKRLLVPALSLTKANTGLVNEVWELLRQYPISVRYSIYVEWYQGPTSRKSAMMAAFARTKLETTSTMKRISKTNLPSMARNLAEIAYTSPGKVFEVALGQIEAYANLTEVVVECAKYFTDLGYDVLVWSLLNALGGQNRNRNDSEFALLPSKWLLALSRFSGRIFQRYAVMDLPPMLKYITNQLYKGNATDLVILKELIGQMAGIVPDTDFTDAQLAAMTGGELLRQQTLKRLGDKRYESIKTARRLMKGLSESNIGVQLLISIAQHRQSAAYSIDDAPNKLFSTVVDDAHAIFLQFLDLLRSNLSVEEFDKVVPGASELMQEFGLSPPLAFVISRASISVRISTSNGNAKVVQPLLENPQVKVDADGDVGMDASEARPNEEGAVVNGSPKADVQMADAEADSTPSPSTPLTDPAYQILAPIIATVQELQPGTFGAMSPEFYVTFWTAAIGDLSMPQGYDAEMALLTKEQARLMEDRTREGKSRQETIGKDLEATRNKIFTEMGTQLGIYRHRKNRIVRRKGMWFEGANPDAVSCAIVQHCILPRVLLSPSDADFSFRMVRFLHDSNTPNFRTLSFYDKLFKPRRLQGIIFTCSIREAENFGRFLRLVLTDLARWHASASVYEREAWGVGKNLHGFAKSVDKDGSPKALLAHVVRPGDDTVKVEHSFKVMHFTWHRSLFVAIKACLSGEEWMHIRNATTILKAVLDLFPVINFMASQLEGLLETIGEREKGARQDLSLAANSLMGLLKRKTKQKKSITIQEFKGEPVEPGRKNGTVTSQPARSTSMTSKVVLKPTAPEFKPQSRASPSIVSAPNKQLPGEVEDGEVDDAKIASDAAKVEQKKESTEAKSTDSAAVVAPPQKSEVLLRREEFQRMNAAKVQSPLPARLEPRTSAVNPELPNRPDAPFPNRPMERHMPPRYEERRERPDLMRDRPRDRRELSGSDRRPENTPREFGRPERERTRPDPPPKWVDPGQFPARDNRERPGINGSRGPDVSGRLSRESNTTFSERGPPINSERLPLLNTERQELIDPGRAALMSVGNEDVRSDSPRRAREDIRDRTSSRPGSPPRRHGSERDVLELQRDDRSGRNGTDARGPLRGRAEDPLATPVGPRGGRPVDLRNDRGPPGPSERPRELPAFQHNQLPPRNLEPDHGRLNLRQQPDPNFGRLNAPPIQDMAGPPSGPRDGRNMRPTRMGNQPPPRREGRLAEVSHSPAQSPAVEKQPPTGPSVHLRSKRSISGFDAASIGSASLPSTPVPVVPVHPDRLAQIPQPSQPQILSQASPVVSTPASGMHPDRARSFGGPHMPVNQHGHDRPINNRMRPHNSMPSLQTQGPPSGPKSQGSPVISSNGMGHTPTGPASNIQTPSREGVNQRALKGINSVLQGTQVGERSIRSRRPTHNSMTFGPAAAAGIPPPSQRTETPRELVNPARADLMNTPNQDDGNRGERDSRGSKHGHSSSRRSSTERPRGSKHEDRGQRSERRGPERDAERERNSSSRVDSLGGRDAMPGSAGRERAERDSHGRHGRESLGSREAEAAWANTPTERSESRNERGGRPRDSRGEERRDSRGTGTREEGGGSGRKRRGEEGDMGGRPHGDSKRPRQR